MHNIIPDTGINRERDGSCTGTGTAQRAKDYGTCKEGFVDLSFNISYILIVLAVLLYFQVPGHCDTVGCVSHVRASSSGSANGYNEDNKGVVERANVAKEEEDRLSADARLKQKAL